MAEEMAALFNEFVSSRCIVIFRALEIGDQASFRLVLNSAGDKENVLEPSLSDNDRYELIEEMANGEIADDVNGPLEAAEYLSVNKQLRHANEVLWLVEVHLRGYLVPWKALLDVNRQTQLLAAAYIPRCLLLADCPCAVNVQIKQHNFTIGRSIDDKELASHVTLGNFFDAPELVKIWDAGKKV
jgi:hypothetical protein